MAIAEIEPVPPASAPTPIVVQTPSDALGPVAILGDVGAAAAEVAERVRAGVVEIRTRGGGAGAGTIWRADGVIVTNHHVVPRDRAQVTLADGRTLAGVVQARDPRNDLAVLSVEAHDLPAVTVGDPHALRTGELVLAVGHPFGVRGALTIGVVHQPLPAHGWQYGANGRRELVQADVLLGPGNSGGPLTDARGRVVGINAMVYGGLALAVPSHLAARLVDQPEGPPVLGVSVREVSLPPAQAARAGELDLAPDAAVLVLEVEAGSAADQAGILVGDVLLTLDGWPLAGVEALPAALAAHGPGEAWLRLLRGTTIRDFVVHPRSRTTS
jgi:serine protease Do